MDAVTTTTATATTGSSGLQNYLADLQELK